MKWRGGLPKPWFSGKIIPGLPSHPPVIPFEKVWVWNPLTGLRLERCLGVQRSTYTAGIWNTRELSKLGEFPGRLSKIPYKLERISSWWLSTTHLKNMFFVGAPNSLTFMIHWEPFFLAAGPKECRISLEKKTHTVDGSEIRQSPALGSKNPCKTLDFNYQPQLVQDFFHQPTYFIFDAKCIGKYSIHLWILWLKECVI